MDFFFDLGFALPEQILDDVVEPSDLFKNFHGLFKLIFRLAPVRIFGAISQVPKVDILLSSSLLSKSISTAFLAAEIERCTSISVSLSRIYAEVCLSLCRWTELFSKSEVLEYKKLSDSKGSSLSSAYFFYMSFFKP